MYSIAKNHTRFAQAAAVLITMALVAFTPASACADFTTLTDPATLHIDSGSGYLYNNEVNPVTSGLVTVSQNQGGADPLNTPWLLIIGTPNVTTTTATITMINGSTLATAIGTNGTTATLTSGEEAYSQLGISGTDQSNSFTNWSAADSSVNSITATTFGLFEFNISTALTAGGSDTFKFANLPLGTFVIAYGEDSKHLYDTPFTESGLTTGVNTNPGGGVVPVPSSSILFGVGALSLIGFAGFRRFRRLPVAD
jgi:hypothetical protein